MFGSEKSVRKEAGITLIASNCEVVGDVHFNDEVQINGVVEGNVVARGGSKAMVRLSKSGVVKGEIRAPNIVINGQVIGDIYSSKHIELAANAQIKGNVYYSLIEMVMGSRVDGSLVHQNETGKAESLLQKEDEHKTLVTAVPPESVAASVTGSN